MSSVEPFGWRSLLLPCHSLFFTRHSPGFGGREAEGRELEEEGMWSEAELARLDVLFRGSEGREGSSTDGECGAEGSSDDPEGSSDGPESSSDDAKSGE
jgi:hypothetical protein